MGRGSADCTGVLARRTLGVGGAGIGLGAAGRWLRFKESGRTCLALVGLCGRLPVFPTRTPNLLLDGGAGVGLGAAGRRGGFEESFRAWLALGLAGGRAGNFGVLARWTLGVGGALLFGTICWPKSSSNWFTDRYSMVTVW